MNILIALVIAMFVIVGVYVGYHAQLASEQESEEHNITIELEILNKSIRSVQILQNPELEKIII